MSDAMGKLASFWTRIRERRAENRSSRTRILIWSTLAALIFGGLQLGLPLDDVLRMGRNKVRLHDASANFVIVGVDDKSLAQAGTWPWPRRQQAQMADNLAKLGAEHIFFDLDFANPTRATEDERLAATLRRLSGKVTLASRFVIDPVTGKQTNNIPLPKLRRHADTANINVWYTAFGYVWQLPYRLNYADQSFRSLSAAAAGVDGDPGEHFPIDYSIDPKSIPVVSAVDLLSGKVPRELIAGKQVVIGTTAHELGDIYDLPGYGRMPGVYLHVIGAETLRVGRPLDLGWFWPFLLTLFIVIGASRLRSGRAMAACFVGQAAVLLSVPFLLEAQLIFVSVTASLFLLIVAGASLAWSSFKSSYREQGIINSVSGLPNLNALRQERNGAKRTLIAARIQNYAEVASALPPEEEKAMVEQIAGRLGVGSISQKMYHGDEGIFAWLVEPGAARSIGEHLDALHALFRSPVVVKQSQVDLTVTFGFDVGSDRSLANRLGSALVAADEAASDGLRWKEYDPAKLKDAAWRLSLLSQLDAAIEAGDLWVAYQPKLDLPTQTIVGAEALVRWTHPEKGPISPMEFILAAEQSDRIEKLTVFVLERAIGAAAVVNSRGMDFQVSVNLSARLIDHPDLVAIITDLLQKHRLAPNRLSLEITETAALSSGGTGLDALLELRFLGVDISIDDYGTGLSTLDYLKKIPATEIKIDKSFIQAIEKSRSDKLLVHSTIQLAHSLGQKVVAEGVEDQATLQALERMGCDLIQGYLIGRPMNFRALLRHLDEANPMQVSLAG
jgi:EAL domain-containing protein (putative c-di-GMP-specific phosphodiesterase class I)/CHASE2 domain-containing sensor protein